MHVYPADPRAKGLVPDPDQDEEDELEDEQAEYESVLISAASDVVGALASVLGPDFSQATTSSRPWQPPPRHFSRAYLHHLLHTHEMSAHTFLAAHNLAVLDAFFAGIRSTLVKSLDSEYLPSAWRCPSINF